MEAYTPGHLGNDEYPTPPPTSSPKDSHNHQHGQNQSYYAPARIPAQDSYFLSHSTPSSPQHFYGPPNAQQKPLPIEAQSKPYILSHGSSPPFPQQLPQRPSSRTSNGRRTPRPIYFSPTNKPPSPYNANRPKPREGFLGRMKDKLSELIRKAMKWAKKHPIQAGIASFLPVLAGAAVWKTFKGLRGVTKEVFTKIEEGMGGGGRGLGKSAKKEVKKPGSYGWGLDHFVGFGGTKQGPLDGIMKVLQLYINHYTKLSPSMFPRTLCILLDLYFLEKK
ncbi:hypothetical protein B0J14DRAFT_490215 [Halenospora varia]|nr:hypothetical protein B0J14DRAFT_490215 [Halenospora varia]